MLWSKIIVMCDIVMMAFPIYGKMFAVDEKSHDNNAPTGTDTPNTPFHGQYTFI